MGNSPDTACFEYFMQPAEGTPACDKFFARVEASGFTVKKGKPVFGIAEFDADEMTFVYDPKTFNFFVLLHEKQHLIEHERVIKAGIPLRKVFNSKIMKVVESHAYLTELQVCDRYNFPPEFTDQRRALLHEYIHKARVALRNNEGLRSMAAQVLGYDIYAHIESYLE